MWKGRASTTSRGEGEVLSTLRLSDILQRLKPLASILFLPVAEALARPSGRFAWRLAVIRHRFLLPRRRLTPPPLFKGLRGCRNAVSPLPATVSAGFSLARSFLQALAFGVPHRSLDEVLETFHIRLALIPPLKGVGFPARLTNIKRNGEAR
jgi:hypothetical protein